MGCGCSDHKESKKDKDECCGGNCGCDHEEEKKLTKEEQVEALNKYKKALEEEIKQVDSALKELS